MISDWPFAGFFSPIIGPMNNENIKQWVTLTSFSDPLEANLALSKLESDGIEAILRDQHTIGINALYTNVLGGVRLDVHPEDIEKARWSLGLDQPVVREASVVCPTCGSSAVKRLNQSHLWAIFSVLFFLPSFGRHKFHCDQCGTDWRRR